MHHPARTWLLVLTALLAFSLAACGGNSEGDSTSAGDSGASSSSQTDSGSDSSESSDESTDEESELLAALEDTGFEIPDDISTSPDALLGGTPYYAAAAAITASLEADGLAIPGLEIHVLPISGTDTSLLVFEMDTTAPAAEGDVPDDITPALSMLVDSEAVQSANVTRVVLNLRGEDEQGPVVLTITMPLEALPAMIEGTLSEEETAEQLRIGVQRQ